MTNLKKLIFENAVTNRVDKSKFLRFALFQAAFTFSFCAVIMEATQDVTRYDYAGLACISVLVVLIFKVIDLNNLI